MTFSGDTKESANLIELANRTDILVHDAIGIKGSPAPASVIDHMLESHVVVDKVGPTAQAAHTSHLVLSHITDIAHDAIDTMRGGEPRRRDTAARSPSATSSCACP